MDRPDTVWCGTARFLKGEIKRRAEAARIRTQTRLSGNHLYYGVPHGYLDPSKFSKIRENFKKYFLHGRKTTGGTWQMANWQDPSVDKCDYEWTSALPYVDNKLYDIYRYASPDGTGLVWRLRVYLDDDKVDITELEKQFGSL